MSFQAVQWALSEEQNTVTPSARLVLIYLGHFADRNNECWPSIKNIAEGLNLSKQTVRKSLALLETDGLISKTPRTTLGPNNLHTFKLNVKVKVSLS